MPVEPDSRSWIFRFILKAYARTAKKPRLKLEDRIDRGRNIYSTIKLPGFEAEEPLRLLSYWANLYALHLRLNNTNSQRLSGDKLMSCAKALTAEPNSAAASNLRLGLFKAPASFPLANSTETIVRPPYSAPNRLRTAPARANSTNRKLGANAIISLFGHALIIARTRAVKNNPFAVAPRDALHAQAHRLSLRPSELRRHRASGEISRLVENLSGAGVAGAVDAVFDIAGGGPAGVDHHRDVAGGAIRL